MAKVKYFERIVKVDGEMLTFVKMVDIYEMSKEAKDKGLSQAVYMDSNGNYKILERQKGFRVNPDMTNARRGQESCVNSFTEDLKKALMGQDEGLTTNAQHVAHRMLALRNAFVEYSQCEKYSQFTEQALVCFKEACKEVEQQSLTAGLKDLVEGLEKHQRVLIATDKVCKSINLKFPKKDMTPKEVREFDKEQALTIPHHKDHQCIAILSLYAKALLKHLENAEEKE